MKNGKQEKRARVFPKAPEAEKPEGKKGEKRQRKDGEWSEGSLCQTIFLTAKVKRPVGEEAVLAEVKKTEAGKKSSNLPGMVKRILNEASRKGLLVKSEEGFSSAK